LYADLGLLTCDPQLTRDVVNLFHYLTGRASKEGAIQALAGDCVFSDQASAK
jgi:polyphosphate kinase